MTEKNYATRLINEYGEKKQTKLDELKALDKKVKRPVRVFAYVFGTIASLILGTGMCFAMQVLNYGEVMQYVGVGIGVIGLGLCSVNYFIYKKALEKRKGKFAQQIVEKSNQLLSEQ